MRVDESPSGTYPSWMRVVAYSTIRTFSEVHPRAASPLEHWYRLTLAAKWHTPADVKSTFRTADIINASRVVFDIHGNDFRLVADINYASDRLFIKFIGTHADYDKIDVATIDKF